MAVTCESKNEDENRKANRADLQEQVRNTKRTMEGWRRRRLAALAIDARYHVEADKCSENQENKLEYGKEDQPAHQPGDAEAGSGDARTSSCRGWCRCIRRWSVVLNTGRDELGAHRTLAVAVKDDRLPI